MEDAPQFYMYLSYHEELSIRIQTCIIQCTKSGTFYALSFWEEKFFDSLGACLERNSTLPVGFPKCLRCIMVCPAMCRTDAERVRAVEQLTSVSLVVLGKSRRVRWVGRDSWFLVCCPQWFEVTAACISSVKAEW